MPVSEDADPSWPLATNREPHRRKVEVGVRDCGGRALPCLLASAMHTLKAQHWALRSQSAKELSLCDPSNRQRTEWQSALAGLEGLCISTC